MFGLFGLVACLQEARVFHFGKGFSAIDEVKTFDDNLSTFANSNSSLVSPGVCLGVSRLS